jgi:hypothetical protein
METLLIIAFAAAFIGLALSSVILYHELFSKGSTLFKI